MSRGYIVMSEGREKHMTKTITGPNYNTIRTPPTPCAEYLRCLWACNGNAFEAQMLFSRANNPNSEFWKNHKRG